MERGIAYRRHQRKRTLGDWIKARFIVPVGFVHRKAREMDSKIKKKISYEMRKEIIRYLNDLK